MATQRWTMATIGGAGAEAVRRRFERWQAARLIAKPDERSSDNWPESVHRDVDRFVAELRDHGHESPVLSNFEWVDTWSMGDLVEWVFGERPRFEAMSGSCVAFCVPLEDRNELNDLVRLRLGRCQHDEERWFCTHAIESIDAWRELASSGVLVIVRRVMGPSVPDEEFEAGLESVPEWLSE